MSDLAGNLASFGLRQVLSFLAETVKTGELRVTSDDVDGRVLFQAGSIGYATTATGADTGQELDALLERYQAGGFDRSAFGDDADGPPATIEDVLLEQLIEVLHQLTLFEDGSFGFTEASDASDSEEIDSFSVEDLLSQVDIRIEEWRKIKEVVPANDVFYQLAARLPHGRREVTLPASQWTLLAALAGESSVAEVAEVLDVYEFHAARKFAHLVELGLLEPSNGEEWDFAEADGYPTSVADTAEGHDSAADSDTGWDFAGDAEPPPGIPRLEPTTEPVTFTKQNLSREEMDEIIRNIGKGIFPN